MTTYEIGPIDSLADGEAKRFEFDKIPVAVVRIGEKVYAIGDTCSHQKVSLSGGYVEAEALALECPKHGAGFCLETGRELSLPATKPVPSYEISISDGVVEVEIP